MFLFYHADAVPLSTVLLAAGEATHITKSLRKKDGDIIQLTDGKGKLFEGVLSFHKHEVAVFLKSFQQKEARTSSLEIAIAPTKNDDRLEWFVEKAIEFGVEKITLLLCDHSEQFHVRQERLQRVAIAAMKQSLKYFLPEIVKPISFMKWQNGLKNNQCIIAHCDESFDRAHIKNALLPSQNTTIAIGPEGDFSEGEIEAAIGNGFKSVSLGKSRLRTETAAISATNVFALNNEF